MDPRDQPIPTPMHQRVEDFRRRRLPLVVWTAAVLLCAWLLSDRVQRFEHIGLARAAQYEISASMTGVLNELRVEAYERVDAGEIVATIDDTELAAREDRSRATIRQLNAELATLQSRLLAGTTQDRAGWTLDLRRFQTDEEDRHLAVLELRATLEGDEIDLKRRELELDRAGSLADSGIISEFERGELELLRDEVGKRLAENRVLLAQMEQEHRAAEARRQEFENRLLELPGAGPLVAPLQEAIAAETARLREIEARRDVSVLRAPIAGQITRVLCRPGQTVVPGEPILTITDGAVTEVIAYLNEADGRLVRESSQVLVSSVNRPGKVVESFVVRVGPGQEEMPPRLWRTPGVPSYGRAVVIAALPGMDLSPGELLSVRLISNP